MDVSLPALACGRRGSPASSGRLQRGSSLLPSLPETNDPRSFRNNFPLICSKFSTREQYIQSQAVCLHPGPHKSEFTQGEWKMLEFTISTVGNLLLGTLPLLRMALSFRPQTDRVAWGCSPCIGADEVRLAAGVWSIRCPVQRTRPACCHLPQSRSNSSCVNRKAPGQSVVSRGWVCP